MNVLEILLIFLSTIIGILGTVWPKTYDDSRKLTQPGKILIVILIITFGFSITFTILRQDSDLEKEKAHIDSLVKIIKMGNVEIESLKSILSTDSLIKDSVIRNLEYTAEANRNTQRLLSPIKPIGILYSLSFHPTYMTGDSLRLINPYNPFNETSKLFLNITQAIEDIKIKYGNNFYWIGKDN